MDKIETVFYNNYELNQLITCSTCIDHVWTNQPSMYTNLGTIEVNLSDHLLIYAVRKSVKISEGHKYIRARSFRNFDEEAFNHDLKHQPWDILELSLDINTAWNVFKDMLMSVCDIYSQVKSLRVCTKKAEWINDEYLELRRKSMRAKHLANIAKNGELYGTAKVLRNRLNNLGVKHIKQYFNKIIYDNKGNTNKLWTTLKSLFPSKKSTHIYTHTGDKPNNHDVANHFTEHFASVGQIQDDQFDTIFEVNAELNENNGLINNQQNFKFCPVSTSEVLKLLRKIPLGKAFGMDGINGRFF